MKLEPHDTTLGHAWVKPSGADTPRKIVTGEVKTLSETQTVNVLQLTRDVTEMKQAQLRHSKKDTRRICFFAREILAKP